MEVRNHLHVDNKTKKKKIIEQKPAKKDHECAPRATNSPWKKVYLLDTHVLARETHGTCIYLLTWTTCIMPEESVWFGPNYGQTDSLTRSVRTGQTSELKPSWPIGLDRPSQSVPIKRNELKPSHLVTSCHVKCHVIGWLQLSSQHGRNNAISTAMPARPGIFHHASLTRNHTGDCYHISIVNHRMPH